MIKIPLTPNFKTAALDYSFKLVTSSFSFKGNYIKGRVWGFHPLHFPHYVRSTEDSQSELVNAIGILGWRDRGTGSVLTICCCPPIPFSFLAEFHKQLL